MEKDNWQKKKTQSIQIDLIVKEETKSSYTAGLNGFKSILWLDYLLLNGWLVDYTNVESQKKKKNKMRRLGYLNRLRF